jgi:hypothetical protein
MGMRVVLPLILSCALAAPAFAEDAQHQPAYRVSSGSIRVALLPVRCGRDMQPELCGTLDESLGVELSRDPRLDVLSPHDLEVLMGAQQLQALQACEGETCFDPNSFQQVGAAYLVSVTIGRIGNDALITARLVDMKRGTVLDRDDARVSKGSESAIDIATRELVQALLVRRGIGTALSLDDGDAGGGSPGVFYTGATLTTLGVLGVVGGGVLGGLGYLEASALNKAASVDKVTFDQGAATARGYALGADVALVAGSTLAIAGVVMMIAGSL